MARSSVRAEINITPLIDVMLVLLVVFMLIAPNAPRVLGAGLPRAGGGQSLPVLVVTVEAEVFRLGEDPIAGLPALETALREKLATRRDRTVLVRVEGEVPYARVVSALDTARGAGAERLGIVPSRLAPVRSRVGESRGKEVPSWQPSTASASGSER